MTTFYLLAALLAGVIGANVLKSFIPKIPDAFILIGVGWLLSLTPYFHHYELEPEFFMVLIIAPLLFFDGSNTKLGEVRQRFNAIFLLSGGLAVITALFIGFVTNHLEAYWTLPLAMALASIVTPTDAVAVKSLTTGSKLPGGVHRALEYEALFNDGTGLVLLSLALSVLETGTFSWVNSLQSFAYVVGGGIIAGLIVGQLMIWVRWLLNQRAITPETTLIPISLLTPYIVYLVAEHFHTSGILAAVAAGLLHNFESQQLQLTSSRTQVTTQTIWQTLSALLNNLVFLMLGLSLPGIYHAFMSQSPTVALEWLFMAIFIYVAMLLIRFFWASAADQEHLSDWFGSRRDGTRKKNAWVFALGGVHGTITLAMAFSLPLTVPHRDELIAIATVVILLSMLVPALVFPRILPAKEQAFTEDELTAARIAMIDSTVDQLEHVTPDKTVRKSLISQIQSQKGFIRHREVNRAQLQSTAEHVLTYLNSDDVVNLYEPQVVKGVQMTFAPFVTQSYQQIAQAKRLWRMLRRGFVTKKQRERRRQMMLEKYPELLVKHDNFHAQLDDLLAETSAFITKDVHKNVHDPDMQRAVIVSFEHYVDNLRHREHEAVPVPTSLFVQAFQLEYNFVQQALEHGTISEDLAQALYNEINEAQTLQLQQLTSD